MKLEEITISSQSGEIDLCGLRYRPDGSRRGLGVALAHGFTSGKYSLDSVAGYLAGKGVECITFDTVGHKLGCSGGRMERIEQAAENLRDVIDWMRAAGDYREIALIGHSMGGAAAIQAAAWDGEHYRGEIKIKGIASLCMGVSPARGFESVAGAAMLAQRADYVTGRDALELLQGLDGLLESARLLHGGLPALLVAARNDVLLPVSRVEQLAGIIGPNAEFRVIDAMHLDAPDRARGLLLTWLEGLAG